MKSCYFSYVESVCPPFLFCHGFLNVSVYPLQCAKIQNPFYLFQFIYFVQCFLFFGFFFNFFFVVLKAIPLSSMQMMGVYGLIIGRNMNTQEENNNTTLPPDNHKPSHDRTTKVEQVRVDERKARDEEKLK